jgi:antitoxin component YwqK of YwqJK toxin-antitoxin module
MASRSTKNGELRGISGLELFADGSIKACMVQERNELATPYGLLVPQYDDGNVRRKYTDSISFYKNGNIKSIALHEQTVIQTSIGLFPAELLTFYESGKLKRLFPLNGKITGYWTEENEYALSQEYEFQFLSGNFRANIISIYFYENGAVKGLTFWPKVVVSVSSPVGKVDVRIGLSLYPNGKLRSLEPHTPLLVNTPIGNIEVYDPQPIGVHGDSNSLVFYDNGRIKSLISSNAMVSISDPNGEKAIYGPQLKPSLLDDNSMEVIPLLIEFYDGKVGIGNKLLSQYEMDKYSFAINTLPKMLNNKCSDCSMCASCA